MKRRTFLQSGLLASVGAPLLAALREEDLAGASEVLAKATAGGQVNAAVLHVRTRDGSATQAFGQAQGEDAMFLLGSISKPICMLALMTLYDQAEFTLDDPLHKFLPAFRGDGREQVTMQHLLTHVSGLPDQLPENATLRQRHAPLRDFVEHAIRTPLHFAAGSQYQYSSMGILLAARVAEVISGQGIREFVDHAVFQPLKLKHSAQGLGRFALADMVPVQTEHAAAEAGAGDPRAQDWDWNSAYWRALGVPWGGTHASAADVGAVLAEVLDANGVVIRSATAQLMVQNHNRTGLPPRGLAWNVGPSAGSAGCSAATFGHTGSTGTLAWADPVRQTVCVVLTSLPGRARVPHPRELAAARIARAN
jgi:CubicO group peptidase (beta-lactamase class C family)